MSGSRRSPSDTPTESGATRRSTSKRRLVLVVAVLLVGIVVVAFVTGVLGVPSVTGVENRFGGVNESTTVIESDLHVRNPNPIGVQLGGVIIDYAVTMNGITMATGAKSGLTVTRGNSTVPFTTYMANSKIPAWWSSHIRNGERTTLAVNADIRSSLLGTSVDAPRITRSIDTDILEAFNTDYDPPKEINVDKEPVVRDPVLVVTSTGGSWGAVTEAETQIELSLTLRNPKPYPIHITKIGYDIGMNDVSVGAGSTDHSYTIPPESSRTIETTIVIENQHLDQWWVTHLQRNQVTAMTIDFYVVVDLSEVGAGSIRIPLDTMEQTIETDFFGNKASA